MQDTLKELLDIPRLIYISEIKNLVIRKSKIVIITVFGENIPNDSEYVIADKKLNIFGFSSDDLTGFTSVIYGTKEWYKLKEDITLYRQDDCGISHFLLIKDTEVTIDNTTNLSSVTRILIRNPNIKERLRTLLGEKAKYIKL